MRAGKRQQYRITHSLFLLLLLLPHTSTRTYISDETKYCYCDPVHVRPQLYPLIPRISFTAFKYKISSLKYSRKKYGRRSTLGNLVQLFQYMGFKMRQLKVKFSVFILHLCNRNSTLNYFIMF